jgi:protocatechuate 3,4-dioxygenase beta subunit
LEMSRMSAVLAGALLLGLALLATLSISTCVSRQQEAAPDPQRAAGAVRSVSNAARRVRDPADPAEPSVDEKTVARAAEEHPSDAVKEIWPDDRPIDLPLHTLRGRVVDPAGAPVAGVKVELISTWLPDQVVSDLYNDGWPHAWDTARSGADGTFALRWFDGGIRSLHIQFGERTAWIGSRVVEGEAVEIVSAASGVHVGGRVTWADGTPASGVKVLFLAAAHPGWEYWKEVRPWIAGTDTDSTGRFTMEGVPIGTMTASVYGEDDAPELSRVVEVPRTGADALELVAGTGRYFDLRGQVLDSASGHPIAGASIRISHGKQAEAADDGRYEIKHIPSVAGCVLEVTASHFGLAWAKRMVVCADDSKTDVVADFGLVRAATIRLRSVDPGGKPLAGVVVAAISESDSVRTDGVRCVTSDTMAGTTDDDGNVALSGLAPGSPDTKLGIRFWVAGVPAGEQTLAPLAVAEERDLGDVVLSHEPAAQHRR